jgi:hypothetical protein
MNFASPYPTVTMPTACELRITVVYHTLTIFEKLKAPCVVKNLTDFNDI